MTSEEIFAAAAKANPGNTSAPEISSATYPETVFFFWLAYWGQWYEAEWGQIFDHRDQLIQHPKGNA